MSNTTDPAADTAGHANGGDTPNAGAGDIDAKINKAMSNWMKRLEAKIPQLVEAKLEAMVQEDGPPSTPTAPSNSAPDAEQRLTLKSLQEQVAKLQKGIETERAARVKAEDGNRTLRVRSEVESHVLRHLGADSPNLPLVLSHFLPQFADKDGAVVRRHLDEYGQERFVAVKDAVDELFKQDLKHLLPARNGSLPPARVMPTNGSPFRSPGPTTPAQMNPLAAEFIEGLAASGRPEMANMVLTSMQQNGTTQK